MAVLYPPPPRSRDAPVCRGGRRELQQGGIGVTLLLIGGGRGGRNASQDSRDVDSVLRVVVSEGSVGGGRKN